MLSSVSRFPSRDGGYPGTPESPGIWLFGIEPGKPTSDEKGIEQRPLVDDLYSVTMQMRWPFNRNAFKLLTVIDGHPINEWCEFAKSRDIFSSSRGYLKGNLYPRKCKNVKDWTAEDAIETGFANKSDYREYCQNKNFPLLQLLAKEYQPRLIICVGIQYTKEFMSAFHGRKDGFTEHRLQETGHRINLAQDGNTTLVVTPHLSRPLNGHAALQEAGNFIRSNAMPA